MSAIYWANAISADFSAATDWTGGVVPGPDDDAILGALGGTPYTVGVRLGTETVNSIQTAANATLAVDERNFTATNGSGTGVNAGTISIWRTSFYLGGVLDNPGRVSGGFGGGLTVLPQGATLTGGGHVEGDIGATPGQYGTLVNVNNTIFGAYQIGGGADVNNKSVYNLSLVNDQAGVIAFEGKAPDGGFSYPSGLGIDTLTNAGVIGSTNKSGVYVGATGAIINSGTIENETATMTFKRGILVGSDTIANTGLIEAIAAGDMLFQNATIDNAGGVIMAHTGDEVQLAQVTLYGGTLNSGGTGEIVTEDSKSLLGAAGSTLTNLGLVYVAAGDTLTVAGSIANAGTLGVGSGSSLAVQAAGVTVSGHGAIALEADGTGTISGATLTNTGKIEGAGTISASLINNAGGLIEGDVAKALTVAQASLASAGEIVALGGGEVVVEGALDNTGLVYADGGNITLQGSVTGTGAVSIKDGTLTFDQAFGGKVFITNVVGDLAELALADSAGFTGVINGLSTAAASSLDLQDIDFATAQASYAGTAASGVLTVSDGTHTATLRLNGDYLNTTFKLAADSHTGTLITDRADPGPASASAAAFAGAAAAFGAPAAHTAPPAAGPRRGEAFALAPPRHAAAG